MLKQFSFGFSYSTIKNEMQEGNSKTGLAPGMHMLAAAQSGVLTLAMTNPIWVVKTRLCLQYDAVTTSGVGGDGKKTYKGMLDAFYKIGRYEGMRGLYKGFVPGLWGVSHGAIQFMAYEELKSRYNRYKEQPIDSKLVGATFSIVMTYGNTIYTHLSQLLLCEKQYDSMF